MADPRVFELDDLVNRPGTYFNPQTEVVVIVDDSASIDQEVFDKLEGYGGAEWVRVSDDVPVDEDGRDRALESFEAQSQGETLAPGALEESEDDFEEEEERPEDSAVPEDEE